jgi:hypothetical protein
MFDGIQTDVNREPLYTRLSRYFPGFRTKCFGNPCWMLERGDRVTGHE